MPATDRQQRTWTSQEAVGRVLGNLFVAFLFLWLVGRLGSWSWWLGALGLIATRELEEFGKARLQRAGRVPSGRRVYLLALMDTLVLAYFPALGLVSLLLYPVDAYWPPTPLEAVGYSCFMALPPLWYLHRLRLYRESVARSRARG